MFLAVVLIIVGDGDDTGIVLAGVRLYLCVKTGSGGKNTYLGDILLTYALEGITHICGFTGHDGDVVCVGELDAERKFLCKLEYSTVGESEDNCFVSLLNGD